MPTETSEQAVQTLEVTREEEIQASIDVVFKAILEEIRPVLRNTRRFAFAFEA